MVIAKPYLQAGEHEEVFLRYSSLHRSVERKKIQSLFFLTIFSTKKDIDALFSFVSYLKSVKSLINTSVKIIGHFITFLSREKMMHILSLSPYCSSLTLCSLLQ